MFTSYTKEKTEIVNQNKNESMKSRKALSKER